jgi:hypothetical protein
LYPLYPSWSGALRSGRCPCRLGAAKSDEARTEGIQEEREATEEGAEEGAKIAKESDEKLEKASLHRSLIASLHASLDSLPPPKMREENPG